MAFFWVWKKNSLSSKALKNFSFPRPQSSIFIQRRKTAAPSIPADYDDIVNNFSPTSTEKLKFSSAFPALAFATAREKLFRLLVFVWDSFSSSSSRSACASPEQ